MIHRALNLFVYNIGSGQNQKLNQIIGQIPLES